MTAIGGSIRSISMDGREFGVAADADLTRKLGGYENDTQENGNQSARLIKTSVSWMIDGITLSIDDDIGEQEYLQNLADTNDYFNCTITFASGLIYNGKGQITGELTFSSQNATASMTLKGTGKLTKQS